MGRMRRHRHVGFQDYRVRASEKVVASEDIKSDIKKRIGIKKCARKSGFDRNFIRKLLRELPVKRNSYNEFVRWLQSYKSKVETMSSL